MPIKQECKKEYYPLSFALPFLLKQNLFERENLGPLIKIPFAPRTVGSFLNSDDRSISSLLRTTLFDPLDLLATEGGARPQDAHPVLSGEHETISHAA